MVPAAGRTARRIPAGALGELAGAFGSFSGHGFSFHLLLWELSLDDRQSVTMPIWRIVKWQGTTPERALGRVPSAPRVDLRRAVRVPSGEIRSVEMKPISQIDSAIWAIPLRVHAVWA